jgi:membrane fusion protein
LRLCGYPARVTEALFREQVIEEGRNRLTGTVIAAVPPSSRLYTRLVALAAALLVGFLVIGHYTMTADVRGIVAYDAGVARVYPREPAEVAAIHVREGQHVEKGQPLVTLAIAQGPGGLSSQLTQIGNQDTELTRQLGLASAQSTTEIAALDQQAAGYADSIASLERQRAFAGDQIKLAESAARRAERLAAEGAGTQRQVEDSRSALLARRAEYENLSDQLITQRTALHTVEANRDQKRVEAEKAQSTLQGQRAALAQQQAELSRTDSLVLTAPIAGTVGDIPLEIGQQASPSKSIVSVIPANSRLEIWLYAPTRAVGNAKPGQHVRLQFDAFPYQKYGTGLGVVTAVSKVPTEPDNLDPMLNVSEPMFRIRTRIEKLSTGSKIDLARLRPGMTLNAKLETERRSLWQVLVGPVFEGMR